MKKSFLITILIACSIGIHAQINGVLISDSNNIRIIKVWGTHQERGFAQGSLLGEAITALIRSYLKPQFGSLYPNAREMVTNGSDLSFDPDFVDEAKAIVAGMDSAGTNTEKCDYVDLLVANSLMDISKMMGSPLPVGCSSLISWGLATEGTDLSGHSVISRHMDWPVNLNLINNQVICIHLPSEPDEQPWLGIGYAGVFGVNSGFNQNLGVFSHTMADLNAPSSQGKHFEPMWLCLRKSIEKLDYNSDGRNNVLDVRSALSDHPQGFADGFLISAVAQSSEGQDSLIAMIAEVAPAAPCLTFRSNSLPDSIPGKNLYTANCQIARNQAMHFCSRYNRINAAIGVGNAISSIRNWELMRDYSHQSIDLQFMQFAPESDLFKISVYQKGKAAYLNEPVTYKISELFSAYSSKGGHVIAEPTFSFYPNPVTDKLSIRGFSRTGEAAVIAVHDINGRQLVTETRSGNSPEYSISLKSLPSGIYFIKVQEGKRTGSLKVWKL